MRGKLPWQGVTGRKKMERYLKVYKMKKNIKPEDLCKGLPTQVTDYMRYVKQLGFEQTPDYKYLINLFRSILQSLSYTSDLIVFSWIRMADAQNLKKPVDPSSRRHSPQARIYKILEANLRRERNTSSDENSGQKSVQTCQVTINNITTTKIQSDFRSNDELVSDLKIKTKKYKSKEGLNTLVANLNKTLDEKLMNDIMGEDNIEKSNDRSKSNDKSDDKINDIMPKTLNNKIEKKLNQNNTNHTANLSLDFKKDHNKGNIIEQISNTKEKGGKNKEEYLFKNKTNKEDLIVNENQVKVKPFEVIKTEFKKKEPSDDFSNMKKEKSKTTRKEKKKNK